MEALIVDASELTSTMVDERDLMTIRFRSEHEGLSFLTITLPNFLTDFMICLEVGRVSTHSFIGWKKRACLPAFLQGFTKLVFNMETGRLLTNANINAIAAIRQICSFVKKVKIECTSGRIEDAYHKYICTDQILDTEVANIPYKDIKLFSEISRLLVGTIFVDYSPDDILVHHGPGATADGRKGNDKFNPNDLCYYSGLVPHFPPGEGVLFANPLCEFFSKDAYIPVDHKVPVRVTHVPKTLKTPRIIAMEPTSNLLIQQGIKDYIVKKLEEHPLTRGHINFTSQAVNQRLALQNSITKTLATLDLSEASDRVHNELVKLMFDSNQLLLEDLQNSRSEEANVRGSMLTLNKFASMGSALCFPIESIFFFIVLIMARYKAMYPECQSPLSLRLINRLREPLFVYGDDLIVPTNEVDIITRTLRLFGNVVGLSKSFYRSSFRESCGCDAYAGRDITPVYLRILPPSNCFRPHEVVSFVATSNLLYSKGYERAAALLRRLVESQVGVLPVFTTKDHDGLGWNFGLNQAKTRFNPELQRLEVRTLVARPVYKQDRLTGYSALLKCLRSMEIRDSETTESDFVLKPCSSDPRHLSETPMRYTIKLKYSWVPAS